MPTPVFIALLASMLCSLSLILSGNRDKDKKENKEDTK